MYDQQQLFERKILLGPREKAKSITREKVLFINKTTYVFLTAQRLRSGNNSAVKCTSKVCR